MFWVKIIFLTIVVLIALLYAIYHICMGIMLQRARKRGKDWILLTHEAYEFGRKGDYHKAIELAEKAIELNPKASEACRLIGNSYELLGDEAQQHGIYEQAVEYHRKATEAWNRAKKNNPKIRIPGYHE